MRLAVQTGGDVQQLRALVASARRVSLVVPPKRQTRSYRRSACGCSYLN